MPKPLPDSAGSPLAGKRIVVTRAREQAEEFCHTLAELGAEPVLIPTIEIRDPESWDPFDNALRRLEDFDYLLVTSANGARRLLDRMRVAGLEPDTLKRLTVGAIGPATAAELEHAGVLVDFVPSDYRAEGLLDALAGHPVRGKGFLIPRAKVARDLVPRVLAERGARVEVVEAYRTAVPVMASGEFERLLTPRPDAITFTSSSTATHFSQLLGKRPVAEVLEGVVIVSIGPVTSDTLRRLRLTVDAEADEYTLAGVVRALEDYFRRAPGH